MKKTIVTMITFCLFMPMAAWAQVEYKDGTYEANTNIMDIAVTVKDNKIVTIEILEHRGGGRQYGDMLTPLIERILQTQSTQVDGVTGATVSSDSLKEAVNDGLEKARK